MTQVEVQVELGIDAERLKIIHAPLHDGSAGNGIVVPDQGVGRACSIPMNPCVPYEPR